MKHLFPVSTNQSKRINKPLSKRREARFVVSVPNELLWAIIGLLLTIFGTFIEAIVATPAWNLTQHGIHLQSLGVTYQIGAVLLTGCLGGRNAGALSQIAYVILGLTWLPIFAQGGGLGYLQQPSFGYIVGFIPGAWLCGLMAFRSRARLESLAFSSLCGLLVIHLFGLIYLLGLSLRSSSGNSLISLHNLPEMIMNYSVAPLPGQLVIVCAVALIAFLLRYILLY